MYMNSKANTGEHLLLAGTSAVRVSRKSNLAGYDGSVKFSIFGCVSVNGRTATGNIRSGKLRRISEVADKSFLFTY